MIHKIKLLRKLMLVTVVKVLLRSNQEQDRRQILRQECTVLKLTFTTPRQKSNLRRHVKIHQVLTKLCRLLQAKYNKITSL